MAWTNQSSEPCHVIWPKGRSTALYTGSARTAVLLVPLSLLPLCLITSVMEQSRLKLILTVNKILDYCEQSKRMSKVEDKFGISNFEGYIVSLMVDLDF